MSYICTLIISNNKNKTAMEVTGAKISYINPVKTPTATKPDFQVLEFGVILSQEINFQMVEKPFGFQTSKADVMKKVEAMNIGDTVNVTFGIRGSKKEKPELAALPKNPTNMNFFTSLDAFDVVCTDSAGGKATQPTQNQSNANPTGAGDAPPKNASGEDMVFDPTLNQWVDKAPF